jgi:hypothetical protein
MAVESVIAGLSQQGLSSQLGMVAGGIQSLYGFYQMIKGNKMMRELEKNRPLRSTNENYLYNQQLAQNIASQGIPDYAKNYYSDAIDRQLQSGINAIQMGGGDINQISALNQVGVDWYNKMMAQDVEQKLANQKILMDANTRIGDEEMVNWDYNVNIPFQQRYNRATQMSNAGAQNFLGGINMAAGITNAASTIDYSALNNILEQQGYGKYTPPNYQGAPNINYGYQVQPYNTLFTLGNHKLLTTQ